MSAHVTTFKAFLKAHETGLIQRTPAWVKARKHTIGASEMAVLTRALIGYIAFFTGQFFFNVVKFIW